MRRQARGAVLVVVLVLTAAGMTLSAAVATTAAMELAMAARSAARLRAFEAAEAGLTAALASGEWSAAAPWTGSGALGDGGNWIAEIRLVAARIDPLGGPVDWRFEVESSGRNGTAQVKLLQGFGVLGALPGTPQLSWWRQAENAP